MERCAGREDYVDVCTSYALYIQQECWHLLSDVRVPPLKVSFQGREPGICFRESYITYSEFIRTRSGVYNVT
jgi:hypothetical protein